MAPDGGDGPGKTHESAAVKRCGRKPSGRESGESRNRRGRLDRAPEQGRVAFAPEKSEHRSDPVRNEGAPSRPERIIEHHGEALVDGEQRPASGPARFEDHRKTL